MHLPTFITSHSLPFKRPRSTALTPTLCQQPPPHPNPRTSRPHPRPRPRPSPPPSDPRDDRWAPENLGFIHIATITGPHGVKGEAKVLSEGQFSAQRLGSRSTTDQLSQRYLLLPGRRYPRPVQIGLGRRASQKDTWILRVAHTTSREEVLQLRGARIYVKEHDRPKLQKGEFMVGDLVRGRVRLIQGDVVGVIETVVTRDELCRASGAGAAAAAVASDLIEVALFHVAEVERTSVRDDAADLRFRGEIPDDAKRVLVPFVKEIVPFVDVQRGEIALDPPQGLLDIAVVNRKEKRRAPRGLLMPAKHVG